MFLTKDNRIKWRAMGWGALIVAILLGMGIAWYDKSLFLFLRQFDCDIWKWMNAIFDGKVWIFGSLIAVLFFCVKKCVKTDCNFIKCANRLKFSAFLRNFLVNIKNNNAFLIFCSVLCAGIVVKLLKIFIGRARPIFFEALDMTGFFSPSLEWAFNSMPSGHAAVSFAGLCMIGMLAPRYKVVTWTLAIVIGFSRIAIGAHWPSDVIFGAFVGIVVADIVKSSLLLRK
ncbi:MAG: phosphatase PAP2 family protein [Alphaproteobacteria bacterium]|nr:phosphatase PAP2 family protein [Alphaproteobacteria bacterium]